MNVGEWIAVGGAVVTVAGWFIRLERRFAGTLSRAEHDRICAERNERVEKGIDDVRCDMERRHQENRSVLAQINEATTSTNERIDQVYDHLINLGSSSR